MDDRISQLPEPILGQIVSHLSTKHAFRTPALSKAWRHVASTRPNFELREELGHRKTNRKTFFSFLHNTLQRYLDHNIPIQSLVLEISYAEDPDTLSLLDKWIPIVLVNTLVKRLDLLFQSDYYPLPPIVLRSESLDELHLRRGRLSPIDHDSILLSRLRTLSLTNVHVSDETLERMISIFPLIERVTLTTCNVFGAIKVSSNNLKHFSYLDGPATFGRLIVEIDSPSIETLRISGHGNRIHAPNHSSFARLKSLFLCKVRLSENSFISLSDPDYFGCLEDLTLFYCRGFQEFRLTSCSVKKLTLILSDNFDIDVNVPNIVRFELSYYNLQPTIFFTTTSREWKSEISFPAPCRVYDTKMLLNVYQLHKAALSPSEFTLHIPDPSVLLRRVLEDDDVSLYPPAVGIERLSMRVMQYSSSSVGAFLSHLFCFFHPRYIYADKYDCRTESRRRDWYANKECLVGILVDAKIPGLEEVSIESFKEKGEQQYSVCGLSSNESQNIRLRLKWGES